VKPLLETKEYSGFETLRGLARVIFDAPGQVKVERIEYDKVIDESREIADLEEGATDKRPVNYRNGKITRTVVPKTVSFERTRFSSPRAAYDAHRASGYGPIDSLVHVGSMPRTRRGLVADRAPASLTVDPGLVKELATLRVTPDSVLMSPEITNRMERFAMSATHRSGDLSEDIDQNSLIYAGLSKATRVNRMVIRSGALRRGFPACPPTGS